MSAASSPHKPVICRAALLEAATSLRLVGATASASARLIRMLCDETVGADELSIRIERDPVLCARVLRVANSAFYAQQRSVTSIRRALLVVGLNAVRGIAAAACIDQVMPPRVAALPDTPALLRHSLATGLASEMLAACRFPALTDRSVHRRPASQPGRHHPGDRRPVRYDSNDRRLWGRRRLPTSGHSSGATQPSRMRRPSQLCLIHGSSLTHSSPPRHITICPPRRRKTIVRSRCSWARQHD